MARKRMIDPTIWQDEEFGTLSSEARLLFIGLFSNADDEGRIRANPAYLKSTIFMYDDISLQEIKKVLSEVVTVIKTVQYYIADGKEYIQLKNWDEYQKQRKERIVASTLPPYDAKCQTDVRQMSAQVKLSKVKLSKVNILATPESVAEIEPNNKINFLIGLFKDVNPNFEKLFSNKTQRKALEEMVVKLGDVKVEKTIRALRELINKPYAPVITTPLQLQQKMGDLIAFANKHKSQTEGKVAIQA